MRINPDINGIFLENLSESVRAVHSGLRISRADYLVEQVDLKGTFGGGEGAVNGIVHHNFYLLL